MAPQMLLELAGLPYEPIRVSLEAGEQRRPEYLAVNPAGKVPTLVTPEGEALAESTAICLWLAERHDLDLAPPPGDPDRGTFLRWLLFLTDTIQPNYRRIYHTATFSDDPEAHAGIRAAGLAAQHQNWQILEAAFAASGGPYVLGQRFSIADLFVVMLATWDPEFEDLRRRLPGLAACWTAVTEHAAVRRVLDAQEKPG